MLKTRHSAGTNSQREQAFESLKECICAAPVLCHTNDDGRFNADCDASLYAWSASAGAIGHLYFLSQFHFNIEYRPGNKHQNADALSRLVPCTDGPNGEPCAQCSRRIVGIETPTQFAASPLGRGHKRFIWGRMGPNSPCMRARLVSRTSCFCRLFTTVVAVKRVIKRTVILSVKYPTVRLR